MPRTFRRIYREGKRVSNKDLEALAGVLGDLHAQVIAVQNQLAVCGATLESSLFEDTLRVVEELQDEFCS